MVEEGVSGSLVIVRLFMHDTEDEKSIPIRRRRRPPTYYKLHLSVSVYKGGPGTGIYYFFWVVFLVLFSYYHMSFVLSPYENTFQFDSMKTFATKTQLKSTVNSTKKKKKGI